LIVRDLFNRFSTGCARFTGRPLMLVMCLLLAAIGIGTYISGDAMAMSGANIAISVVTLLLLPILQATQNRDGAALQAKLDELIKVNADARDALIGLEDRSEEEIQAVRASEEQAARATRAA
jgi:low affinity Fe/Cu permease